ncbi:unnamed protein product [Prunus armeniaca]
MDMYHFHHVTIRIRTQKLGTAVQAVERSSRHYSSKVNDEGRTWWLDWRLMRGREVEERDRRIWVFFEDLHSCDVRTLYNYLPPCRSQKHAVNPAELTTWARTSIAITKGSAFHMSSPKSTWIIDLSDMDHMTFHPKQLISLKPSTQSMVSNANDILTGNMIGCGTRRGKFYYLDWAPNSETKVSQAFTTSGASS